MATKTFQLTLHGTVPADQAFSIGYGQRGGEGTIQVFCGDPQTELAESQPSCKAGVYTRSVVITAGTTIGFAFVRADPGTDEVFHSDTETLSVDMTNSAWYTFDDGTGAGDEQEVPDNQQTGGGKKTDAGEDQQDDTQDDIRQDGEDKDTGKGADDDTQDDTEDGGIGARDDIQDDQQREIPEEVPETGAGGLATGSTIPIGNAVAGLAMLLGTGYAMLQRR